MRHLELSYWNILEDANIKQLGVEDFRGFAYATPEEVEMLSISAHKKETVAFYVFLDELKKAIEFLNDNPRLSDHSVRGGRGSTEMSVQQKRLLFVLKLVVLCEVIAESCPNITAYISEKAEKANSTGWFHLGTLSKIATNIGAFILKELDFKTPEFFIKDVVGGIQAALASTVFTQIHKAFFEVHEVLFEIKKTTFLTSFFDFSTELKKRLQADGEDHSPNDKEVALFADAIIWVDKDLESSAFSAIFGRNLKLKKQVVNFIEIMRLYYKRSEKSIEELRSILLIELAKKTIESKSASPELHLVSTSVMNSYTGSETIGFLAQTYNFKAVVNIENEIARIVKEQIDANAAAMDSYLTPEAYSKAHEVFFATIINSIKQLFSENQSTSLLYYKTTSYSKEEFVRRLSDALKDSYIKALSLSVKPQLADGKL